MAFYSGNENDRKDYRQRDDDDFRNSVYRLDSRSPRVEDEKKMRREIANSNERRRMQSINAGFQSLRALLPKSEGDKLSKAAILQGTVDYVQQLEQEKSFLLSQNVKLSRSVHSCNDSDGSCHNDLPPPLKRKRRKTDLAALVDEGIGSASPSSQSEGEERGGSGELLAQLRQQLQQERELRMRLEGELRGLHKKDHDYTTEVSTKSPTIHPYHRKDTSHSRLTLPEHEIAHHPPRQLPDHYKPPTSPPTLTYRPGQNLAAIVEAIRHVEGYHMFQDDPPSRESTTSPSQIAPDQSFKSQITPSNGNQSFKSEILSDDLSFKSQIKSDDQSFKSQIVLDDQSFKSQIRSSDGDQSFKSQIIKCAPVVQHRAGVIVSNTS